MTFLSLLLNLQHQLVPCLQFKLPLALCEYIPKSSTSDPPSVLSLLSTNQVGPGHFPMSPEEMVAGQHCRTGELSWIPGEYTDFIIFTSCPRALSNKLSLRRPGSFPQPSTASLLLPALRSWIWICLCCFLGTIWPQTSCCCLFLSTWLSEAFYKISPTCLHARLVLLRGGWYKMFHPHQPPQISWSYLLSVAQNYFIICLSFFMQDISMSAGMKKCGHV